MALLNIPKPYSRADSTNDLGLCQLDTLMNVLGKVLTKMAKITVSCNKLVTITTFLPHCSSLWHEGLWHIQVPKSGF